MNKKRYIWIDNIKIFAMFMIVIGHLLQSMNMSNILPWGDALEINNDVLYSFHVQLFFICSGFLYQYKTQKQTPKLYFQSILQRLINLGIPYFVFTTATYIIKNVLSSSVNIQTDENIFHYFFVAPTSPYWFLYALFIFFVISPVFNSKGLNIARVIIAAAICICCNMIDIETLNPFATTITNFIGKQWVWFLVGMAISKFELEKIFKSWQIILLPISIILNIMLYKNIIGFVGLEFIICLCAIVAFLGLFVGVFKNKKQSRISKFLSKYFMPIFLMHTIFAAGFRIVLTKIGINSPIIHIPTGLIVSIVMPIIAGIIMEKIKLDILYNPGKYIKLFKK